VETRFWTAAAGERVDAAVRARTPRHPGALVTVTGGVHRGPMPRDDAATRLVELARACATADGWDVGEMAVGGVSDGNVVAALGVPTVDGMGAEGAGAHGPAEYVVLDSMPRRARWLAAVLTRLTTAGTETGPPARPEVSRP
jgi:glutamate carboxypeptidase